MSDVQGTEASAPIQVNQDVNIHVTEVQAGHTVEFDLKDGRQAYILCVEGNAQFIGTHGESTLVQHDAAEAFGPNNIAVTPVGESGAAHVLLIEMAYTGIGRTDL